MIYVFLADGFEETEAMIPVDILRRAGLKVKTVGVTGKTVKGAHGISVVADIEIEDANDELELALLPGGIPGADNLRANEKVCRIVTETYNRGKTVAAICAAPYILGELGLLKGKEAICYPGFEKQLYGAKISDKNVVKDGNVITAVGMGASLKFALAIVESLVSKEKNDQIKKAIFA